MSASCSRAKEQAKHAWRPSGSRIYPPRPAREESAQASATVTDEQRTEKEGPEWARRGCYVGPHVDHLAGLHR